MKLKTFFISYLLILTVLLGAISTISIYLSYHQIQNLREQSIREYERITNAIIREIDALYQRRESEATINALLNSHINFHANHGTYISIEEDPSDLPRVVTFQTDEEIYRFHIESTLHTNARKFRFNIFFDITEDILNLREIQQILLFLFISFSLIAAVTLYLILTKIFKPLEIVAETSQKISEGNYQERINIKGKNELAITAYHFNQMAKEIENRIKLLEDEANKKQQFIDNLAHEIRTPLTSISGYAQYIQKGNLSEEDRIESTGHIVEEAKHMEKITNSMLELAKLRHFEPQKEKIRLDQLFDQVAITLEGIFHQHQIKLIIEPYKHIVMGQVDLLKSLLLNLCMNAMKACAPKEGEIMLEAKEEDGKTIIIVSDNGCGISQKDISKIMDPFYRIDSARNKKHGGVGLGLALCKQIAQLHGAEMIIESTVNVGTTVKLVFTSS